MNYRITPYNLQELGQRENQEDSLFPCIDQQTPQDRLFILCDGMGGHEKGEVASATVCETMSNSILTHWNPNEPLSDELLRQAIEDAYDALDDISATQTPPLGGGRERLMGTTMTFVCFHANGVTVAHIGDSRIYQLRPATKNESARIVFRTRDHSLVEDLIKIGEITEEEAKTHPQKNVITRAMQPCQERRAKADIVHLTDIKDGDYFYMCSDGMLEESTDENILNIITKKDATNEEKIEILRSVTEDNKDNHTAHLIYINKVEGKPVILSTTKPESVRNPQRTPKEGTWITPIDDTPKKKKKSVLVWIVPVAIIAVLAIAATFFMNGDEKDKEASQKDSDKIEKPTPKASVTNHKNLPANNTETPDSQETKEQASSVKPKDPKSNSDAENKQDAKRDAPNKTTDVSSEFKALKDGDKAKTEREKFINAKKQIEQTEAKD